MIDTGVLLEVLTSNKNELANGFGYATAVNGTSTVVNEYVETIKSIKKTLESKKAEFKAKFPLEYKMNFGGGDSIFSGKINDKSYDKEDDFYHDLLNCWWE